MNPICIVDDQPFICSTVAGILEDEGYQVNVFADAESFWQRLDRVQPALVLLDIWLPGIDGLELLKRLHERFPELPVIMMSGHAGIETAVTAIKAGASDFMEKPLHLEVLLDKVKSALKHRPPAAREACRRTPGWRPSAPTWCCPRAWWRWWTRRSPSAPSGRTWSSTASGC